MQNQCKLTSCYTSTRKLKANVMSAVTTCYYQKYFWKVITYKKFYVSWSSQQTFTCSNSIMETLEWVRCEICSELTIKTSERLHWRGSGVFIVNFEHISHPFLVLTIKTPKKGVKYVQS